MHTRFVTWPTYDRNGGAGGTQAMPRDHFLATPVAGLLQQPSAAAERQDRPRRFRRECNALLRKENVADDLRLLLDSVAGEQFSRRDRIIVPAERVTHERQVEPALGLRLPHVGELVDEESLPVQA